MSQPIGVEGYLADDRPVDLGQVGRHQRSLTRVAAEQLNHSDAFMRSNRSTKLRDVLDAARHRGREADAVVGSEDIVVHGLRHGDHLHSLGVHPVRIAQGVIAADGDKGLDVQGVDHLENLVGEIHEVAARESRRVVSQKQRNRLARHVTGIRARSVQEGAAGPTDGSNRLARQLDGMFLEGILVVKVEIQETGPTAPDTDDFITVVRGTINHRPYTRIQTGDIAPASQDSDSF